MANGNQQAKPMRFDSRLRQIVPAIILLTCLSSALANNPIPTVVGPVVPQAVVPGSGAFTLKVYGANFVSGATVNWNRSPRSTIFISARELQAQILASDVATATAGYITVTNPPPGGGVSSASYGLVEVHTPTSTIIAAPPRLYLKDVGSGSVVVSDFKNNGLLDFAASYGYSEVKDLLGNGNGTFGNSSIAAYSYYGSGPAAIASGDFNNDGNEDLVFGANPEGPPTLLQINLGNGDGTFRKGPRFGHFNSYAFGIAVGDFNRDGNLDLVSVTSPDTLSVFLGQGDGNFEHLADYAGFVDTPFEVVTADFNDDGILDLAVLTQGGPYILIGKGDGTFEKPRLLVANDDAGCEGTLSVSDFNGDGNADFAYCERDQTSGKIWILLGNGDGTFKKPISLPVAAQYGVFSFAAGDFNSDGKTDLVASYLISDTQSQFTVFLGNGDGRFRHRKLVQIGDGPHEGLGIAPADFNSDGLLDFIIQDPGQVVVVVQK
jgi:hypothetical protein